jgi:hypothetical protein
MMPACKLECASPSVIVVAIAIAVVQYTTNRTLVTVSATKRQQDLSLAVLGAQEPDRRSACPAPLQPDQCLYLTCISFVMSDLSTEVMLVKAMLLEINEYSLVTGIKSSVPSKV